MTLAKEDILRKIAHGYDNSRRIAAVTHYNQQYVQRCVLKLEEAGMITIRREPRGYTYHLNPNAALLIAEEV